MNRLLICLRPSRWGLRVRSAAAAAAVVGVVLVLGGGAVLRLLDLSLVRAVDTAAAAHADTIADQLRREQPLGVGGALFSGDGRVSVVQVLDATGRMVRTSSPQWFTPLIPNAVAAGQSSRDGVPAPANTDLRVAARTVTGPAGVVTVLVAADKQPVENTLLEVAQLLAALGPVVVLVAAWATYALVGRSLTSVEAIRTRVAVIETGDLSRRVPIPIAEDEIARLAVTMNEMLARIQAEHEAQRRFVGDASHELRSPLTTILTALEIGAEHPGFLDTDLVTGTLLPEGQRMRQLIEDLLLLAAADQHSLTPRRAEVDLDDLCAHILAAARASTTVALRSRLAAVRVRADPARLERVVRNLVDNAARHAASTVTVTVTGTGADARIIIDDDGPGIPVEHRLRVFDRFARLESDRARDSGGTGLGLAIAADIVAAHHGTITIHDSPGGGARFVVELPTTDPP